MRTPWAVLPALLLAASTNCLPYTNVPSPYQIPSIEQHVHHYEQQAGHFDYPQSYVEHEPISSEGGFTFTCNQPHKVCVKKHLCQNGYVNPYHVGFVAQNHQLQQCDVKLEVCCTLGLPAHESSHAQGAVEVGQTDQQVEQGQVDLGGDAQAALDGSQTAGQGVFQTVEQQGQEQTKDVPESGEASGSVPLGIGVGTGSSSEFVTFAPPIQNGCAAALLCVDESHCTLAGTISPEPLTYSSQQLLRRVPLSVCRNPDNGAIGRCCRDPNYVDPWPTGNLPKNYSGGFDEQGFPTFLNIAKVPPPKTPPKYTPRPPVFVDTGVKTVVTNPPPVIRPFHPVTLPPTQNIFISTPVPTAPPVIVEDSSAVTHFLEPPNQVATHVNNLEDTIKQTVVTKTEYPEESESHATQVPAKCGVKNTVQRRPNMEESITGFAEIPWQAMVLLSEERKILCSGALIGSDSILTAANCVDKLAPSDVSIKLGEWKLGYELKHEEPLPFEILNVNSIDIHPEYRQGYSTHDLAILFLDRPATFDYHVSPLCLPEYENLASESKQCLTTGWGKSILQSHYAGAIMHALNVDVLSKENCENRLLSTEYSSNLANNVICAKPTKERNNVCEADVGGPLACDNGRGIYELTGIYSQDNGCQATNQVVMFAPVDMVWIKATMTSLRAPVRQEEGPTKGYVIPVPDFTLADATNYRESNLTANNQYLPPEYPV